MRSKKKTVKLRKARLPSRLGVILFMVIFVYLTIRIFHSMTSTKLSIYRVLSDTRADVINQRGLILRNEMVFYAEKSGYINYYVNPLSLIAKKDIVYTIDSTGSIYPSLTKEESSVSENEMGLRLTLNQYFAKNEDFSSVYELKSNLKEAALMETGQSVRSNIKTVIDNYGDNQYFYVNYSTESGVVVFGTDGLEGLSVETMDASLFQENQGNLKLPPSNSSKVEVGAPIYKLLREEEWQLVVPITEEQAIKLQEKDFVDSYLGGYSFKARAKVETFQKENENFALLTYYNYMVNFADKRFLNVYISLDSITGLKIAKSSVVEKKFYVVPKDFVHPKSDKLLEKGINLLTFDKKGNKTYRFIETPVYYETDEFSYIEYGGEFSAGDRISKLRGKDAETHEEENHLTTISKVDVLKGVYNVNKGYPEFKRIEIISDIDNEYYLVSDHTTYGLSDYDNIILNAKLLEETKNERDKE